VRGGKGIRGNSWTRQRNNRKRKRPAGVEGKRDGASQGKDNKSTPNPRGEKIKQKKKARLGEERRTLPGEKEGVQAVILAKESG